MPRTVVFDASETLLELNVPGALFQEALLLRVTARSSGQVFDRRQSGHCGNTRYYS